MRLTLSILLASTPAFAQLQPGDVLVQRYHGSSPGSLHHYRPDGTLVATAMGAPAPSVGAALDPDGNWLTMQFFPARLAVFAPDGSFIEERPTPQLGFPGDIGVFADGQVAVAGRDTDTIEVYSPTGAHLASWSHPGLDYPFACHVDASDVLWLSAYSSSAIYSIDHDGNVLGSFPVADLPGDLDMAADGTIWVAGWTTGRVYQYRQDGTLVSSFQAYPSTGTTNCVAALADGTLWVSRWESPALRHYDTSGNLLGEVATGHHVAFMTVMREGLGVRYCSPGNATSTGLPARLEVLGSPLVGNNDLTLVAGDLPPGEFGYFLVGSNQGQFQPPGSQGMLCLACGFQGCGGIGRFNGPGQIIQGPVGSVTIDLTSLPLTPAVAVQPGDRWNFQCWFRDVGSNNFTDAVSVVFH